MWEDCETVEERDRRAPAACGVAMMNAVIADGVTRMTVPDHHAFLARNPFYGVDAR